MPVDNDTLNKNLFDTLRGKGYDPVSLDSKGNPSNEVEKADVFRFTIKDNEEQINIWVTIEGNELVLYTDDKFVKTKDFEPFTRYMKSWAQRKLLGFNVTNKDRLINDMKKRAVMKDKEKLDENYHPMGKKASYNDSVPTVKILIQHTRQIEEGEQRFRNIAKIFVENTNGERFLLPTIRPGLARVYARHIAEGGTPYDDKGKHISTLVEEYTKMAGFVRATRNGQFNESALKLVNEGLRHYNELRMTLQGMASHRGYNKYFESYTPVLNEESTEETNLNELFVQETLDPRIESVMPILNRLSKNITEMSAVKELEEWAQSVTEVEDQTTKTLAEPAEEMLDELSGDLLQKVADKAKDKAKIMAIRQTQIMNPDGYGTLYHDGDIELKDKLGQAQSHYNRLASKAGAHKKKMTDLEMKKRWAADLPTKLKNKVDEAPGAETLKHNQDTEKSNLKAFDLDETDLRYYYPSATKARIKDKIKKKFSRMEEGPADEPVEPDMDADDKRWDDMDEGLDANQKDYREISNLNDFKTGTVGSVVQYSDGKFGFKYGDKLSPQKFDRRRDADNALYAQHKQGVAEDLDANQKRVGQLGPTEPVGKNEKNLRGKLVGASESVELDTLKTLSGIK